MSKYIRHELSKVDSRILYLQREGSRVVKLGLTANARKRANRLEG